MSLQSKTSVPWHIEKKNVTPKIRPKKALEAERVNTLYFGPFLPSSTDLARPVFPN